MTKAEIAKKWRGEAMAADKLRDKAATDTHNHWIWNEEAITLRRCAAELEALLNAERTDKDGIR
jgi:hypothetical protein